MPTRNTKFYSLLLILIDFFALLVAFGLAYVVRVQYDPRPLLTEIYALDYLSYSLMIIPFWISTFALLGLYGANTYSRRLVEWGKLAVGAFMGILIIIGWEYVSGERFFPARLATIYALVGSFVLLVLFREILRMIRSLMFRFGYGTSRVLLIGSTDTVADIARNLTDTKKSGYEIIAVVGPSRVVPQGISATRYPSVESALKDIDALRITYIIQTDLYESPERNQRILAAAQSRHIGYSFIPGEPEFYSGKNTVDVFLGYPMITVHQTPLVGWGAIVKRLFDFIASALLIVLLSPVFLLIALIQKITSPGPVFYISKRLSRFSHPIRLVKFRSMGSQYGKRDAADEFRAMGREDLAKEYEASRKVENDPRITRFGKFLRATSLDELPQLFNVFRGELSMVGPRPILPQEAKLIRGRAALLHSVKSGVTGLWQVSGRSELSFEERIELERFYAQNWSFWLDIKILFKTIGVVIGRKGAK